MDSQNVEITTADYIVVGGGTAGLVVANRLTEDPEVHVLVVEAGPNRTDDPRVNILALWTSLAGSEVDWKFKSVPQPGLGCRSIRMPSGKLFGGSSALNGQAFIAPSKSDIDAWASFGNAGWDWAGLTPSKRAIHSLLPPIKQLSITSESTGLMKSTVEPRGLFKSLFPVSFRIQCVRHPFSGSSLGGYSNAATIDPLTKTRSYAGSAHGIPALQRPNFHLITEATANKILFNRTANGVTATGVQVFVQNKTVTFSASKEVIISAGAFNSPKLLELSGVGNEQLLKSHGIPVVINNPHVVINNPHVGEHLQDHFMTGVSFEVADGVFTGDSLVRQEPESIQEAQKLYAEHKAGPFTVGGIQSHAFMPVVEFDGIEGRKLQAEMLAKYPSKLEDIEYHNAVRSIIENPEESSAGWFIFLAQANLHEQGDNFLGSKFLQENFASLGCIQSHPFSRGSSHISSADVNAPPNIDQGFFSHPADLEILARHVQSLEILRNTKELSPFFKPNGQHNHPDAFHIVDLEGAKKYVLDTALTAYHACGTVSMLPKEKGGVVNEKLVVYGTDNLRVVDASIFPLIPRSNIMSTVYAVAEKAADIIKEI